MSDGERRVPDEPRPGSRTRRPGSSSARSRPRSGAARCPDTVIFLEHPPVDHARPAHRATASCTCPTAPTSRSSRPTAAGKSTFHGPGQLVCYPILDLNAARQGREALLPRPRGGDHPHARRVRRRGRADRGAHRRLARRRAPRKIASIGVHISRWVTTHGYALNVDLDPAPFTQWITACGLEDAAFTTWRASSGGRSRSTRSGPRRSQALRRRVRARLRGAPGRGRRRALGPAVARAARRALSQPPRRASRAPPCDGRLGLDPRDVMLAQERRGTRPARRR